MDGALLLLLSSLLTLFACVQIIHRVKLAATMEIFLNGLSIRSDPTVFTATLVEMKPKNPQKIIISSVIMIHGGLREEVFWETLKVTVRTCKLQTRLGIE